MLGTLYKFFNLYIKPCTHVTEIHDKLIILGVLLYVFSLFQSLFFIYVIACWHICYIAALNELQNTVIDFIL